MMDKDFIDILVCPVSRASLVISPQGTELWCLASGLAYPIRDDIPVLLESEARPLTKEEKTITTD